MSSRTPTRVREPSRLQRRVSALIGAQLAGAVALALLAVIHGRAFGDPWAVGILVLVFALAGFFGMTLEFHRYRFTFTPAEAVLAVGFFFVGPIGLAVAAAVGECVNMLVQRHTPLKAAFNISNRLAATTAAGVAFAVLGRTDVHEAAAWGAALGAALCFSILDVVSTSAVLSIVEETRFHDVFVRSVSTGLLATLTAAPVGLVALDLAEHGPFVPLLLVPITIAVGLNARYAVAQRDEHLRFERLYESSARTASLVALDDSLRVLAAETRALGTGMAALCCATDAAGEWRGAFSRRRRRTARVAGNGGRGDRTRRTLRRPGGRRGRRARGWSHRTDIQARGCRVVGTRARRPDRADRAYATARAMPAPEAASRRSPHSRTTRR